MPSSNKNKMDGSCHQNARAVDKGQEEERSPTLQEWHSPGGSEFLGEPRSVAGRCGWRTWCQVSKRGRGRLLFSLATRRSPLDN